MSIILQISFATRVVLKIGECHSDLRKFVLRRIFSYLMHEDKSRAHKKLMDCKCAHTTKQWKHFDDAIQT